jgi:aconitase B
MRFFTLDFFIKTTHTVPWFRPKILVESKVNPAKIFRSLAHFAKSRIAVLLVTLEQMKDLFLVFGSFAHIRTVFGRSVPLKATASSWRNCHWFILPLLLNTQKKLCMFSDNSERNCADLRKCKTTLHRCWIYGIKLCVFRYYAELRKS